jgi:hypothetical protein
MEATPTVLDEASTLDTWNRDVDSEALQSFVSRRLADEALASVELAVSI